MEYLEEEYKKWLNLQEFIKDIFDIFKMQKPSFLTEKTYKTQRKIVNAISRYFISLKNGCEEAKEKLVSELINNLTEEQLELLRNVEINNNQNNDQNTDYELIVKIKRKDVIFIFGDFEFHLSRKRYNILKFKGDNYDIARMLIRYDSYFPICGTFWSVPPEVYEYLQFECDVKFECFSSPLNNTVDDYCSLFEDTDSIFGSHGDLFKYEFGPNDYLVNPPFIETTINSMIEIIQEKLKSESNYSFYVLLPFWKDLKSFNELINSEFVKDIIDLQYENYKVYDGVNDKYIPGKFKSSFIILSNYDINYNRSEINNLFR